jgi:GntR family transcriptional repressor for pyruvate dehydrogenase complex
VTILARPGDALSHLLRFHLALRHVSVDDLVEFRIVVESWAAAALARRGDPGAVDELRALAEQMAAEPQAGFNDLDAAFHLALVRGAGNELATLIADGARTAIRRTMVEAALAVPDWAAQRARLVGEHREIAEAIACGDADGASARVERHIRDFWDIALAARTR